MQTLDEYLDLIEELENEAERNAEDEIGSFEHSMAVYQAQCRAMQC